MGYTTDFNGMFNLDKPLTPEHKAYLEAFAGTRRMKRKGFETKKFPDPVRIAAGLPIGPEGAYFVGADALPKEVCEDSFGGNWRGQAHSKDILDYNRPPQGQPGLWCQWIPSEDGTGIEWDGGEKFYNYVEWLQYLVENFLKPWGYTLNGEVNWIGEDPEDLGLIVVKDNEVRTKVGRVVYED